MKKIRKLSVFLFQKPALYFKVHLTLIEQHVIRPRTDNGLMPRVSIQGLTQRVGQAGKHRR